MKGMSRLPGTRPAGTAGAWDNFWFSPADVATLAAIRIGTGVMLLYVYGATAPDLFAYIGPTAWVDAAAIARLRGGEALSAPWWGQSVWFSLTTPIPIVVSYSAFMLSIVCFTAGLFTRAANALVCVGHLSFVHRAFLGWSGMDTLLAMLTLYLLLGPSGAVFSVDARRRRGRAPQHSWTANLALRLIQIHMCVIYLSAGLSKLQGSMWWDGTAVWVTMSMHEFAPVDLTPLGHLGDTFALLVSNVGVLLTLALEIGFAFLIWNPTLRPVMLTLAVVLHVATGLLMGLGTFGAVMLIGCLAFVEGGRIRALVRVLPAPFPTARREAQQASC